MDRFVQDFKSFVIPMVEGDGSNVVFPSAGELFVFYKKCMVQCSQLSTGPPLLSLTATFQKFLKEYATRVLNNHLPVKWVEIPVYKIILIIIYKRKEHEGYGLIDLDFKV